MIKPHRLRAGDTIGLIGPSGAIQTPGALHKCIDLLNSWGYRVNLGASAGQKYGYLSGADDLRARDVNAMFRDDTVDAIFCLRGGYGTPRLLPMLDADAARVNPKIFLGYSDITAMHTFYNVYSDLVTFHGPMPTSDMVCEDYDDFTHASLMRALSQPSPLGAIANPAGEALRSINPGVAEGLLVGGNLTLIASSLGTPYAIDPRGKIILIEDINEKTYRLDHMLSHLRNAGAFDACAGVIFGDFKDCLIEYPDFAFTLEEIIRDIVAPCGKPIVANLRAGHCAPKITLPLNINCRVDANNSTIELLESGVV